MVVIVRAKSKDLFPVKALLCGMKEPMIGKQRVCSDDHGLCQLFQLCPNLETMSKTDHSTFTSPLTGQHLRYRAAKGT